MTNRYLMDKGFIHFQTDLPTKVNGKKGKDTGRANGEM